MKYVLILAGGSGSRMGNTEVPKQFIKIDDIPIIMYTIKKFYSIPMFNKIVVVIPEDYKKYLDDLLRKNGFSNVITVIGGSTRYESVLNGCKFILNNLKNDDETIILSHDAVRPFVSRKIIDDNMNVIDYCSAVDTIVPVVDTIIKIDAGKVYSIPNREELYMSQTPQTFRLHEYIQICDELSEDEKQKLTDVCKVYYYRNKKIGFSLGEYSNFKITTPFDLEVARDLIKRKKR